MVTQQQKIAINVVHLREYEAFCCWTFPFPGLTFHPLRQMQMEMATMQTNKTNSVLITNTTNHVTSKPKISPESFAETKKNISVSIFITLLGNMYYIFSKYCFH